MIFIIKILLTDFLVGKLSEIKTEKAQVESGAGLSKGEDSVNCGLPNDCGADGVAVHLFTGQGNNEGPKICVNGK